MHHVSNISLKSKQNWLLDSANKDSRDASVQTYTKYRQQTVFVICNINSPLTVENNKIKYSQTNTEPKNHNFHGEVNYSSAAL